MARGFTASFHAGWGEMDFNGHMANTAYLDLAATTRMLFFRSCGYPIDEFRRRQVGPVVRRDVVEYHREVQLLDEVVVELLLDGLAPDGSRMRLRNTIYRQDGVVAAEVVTDGGWLDLRTRRLRAPPADLLAALHQLPRSDHFEELGSSVAHG